ncbi:hypothetical protein PsorP6_014446 [Peronosclerospora sorghi]|uniref:Uncharacterized protein n=1 Tax=Peronosclerospora sorghi TaxID=230839 RepID=A0ACC0VUX3_9STRA|nr:hypothetical protein PsorP6_014446 [Peronosclerospora sorghi]
MLFDDQQNACYPNVPLTRGIADGRRTVFKFYIEILFEWKVTMSTPVDPNLNPDQPPVHSSCDPVRPSNPPLIALPTFLVERITAFFRKKVTLSGKIKAKKATIQKLSEHDANVTCPKSFQISHTMTFSEGLREFDPEFVKLKTIILRKIEFQYLKKLLLCHLKCNMTNSKCST